MGSAKEHADGTARNLLGVAFLGICGAQVLDTVGLPPSHRMCNMTYIVFVLGMSGLVLGLMAHLDLYWPWPRPELPHVYGGIQDSMLVTFLVSNLLTGAVNLTMQPLLMPPWVALLTISVCSWAWSALVGMLHRRGVVLKFW